MAIHNDIGKNGESLAATYLQSKGYSIICKNWRHTHYEIDIIANKGKKLHFIEVKTRSSELYGHPEDSVTKRKFTFLKNAADEYLHLNPGYQWIQYDILSITFQQDGTPAYFLLEDVFL